MLDPQSRLDLLLTDTPVPANATWPAAEPPGDVERALCAELGALADERVGVLLNGSLASGILALYCQQLRLPVVAVRLRWRGVLTIDDAGDLADWLGLRQVVVEVGPELVETWAAAVDTLGRPLPGLGCAALAAAARAAGVARLLVDAGAEALFAEAGRRWPSSGGWSDDDARQLYGVVPSGWAEWRVRHALRRELAEPDFAAAQPLALLAPPPPPLPPERLAATPVDEARARFDLALVGEGLWRPVLAGLGQWTGVELVAPFLSPGVVAAALGRRVRTGLLRKLAARRLPDDLASRPVRRPRAPDAHWLLGDPLPAPVAAVLNGSALRQVGWFEPVTLHRWRQLLRDAPDDATHQLRGRLVILAAGLQRLALSA